MAQNPNLRATRASFAPWVVLALGALLSLGGAAWTRQAQVARTAAQVGAEGAAVRRDLTETLHTYEEVMIGLRGLIMAKGDLDFETFHDYVTDSELLARHRSLLSVTFGYFVDPAGRDAFVRRMRGEWAVRGVAFAIQPPGERPDYFVLGYGEPLAPNLKVVGTDTLTIPGNRETLEQTVATGQVVLSGPIAVVQYQGPDPGVLLRVAVPRRGLARGATLADRRRATLGCLTCVFRASQLVRDSLGPALLARNDVWIRDLGPSSPGAPRTGAGLPVFGAPVPEPGRWQRLLKPCPPSVQVLDLLGRAWAVHVTMRSTAVGEQEWLQPLAVAGLGLIATFLFAGLLGAEQRVGQRARLMATRMTQEYLDVGDELKRSQANLSAVIGSTTDLVWSVGLDYCFLTFNPALAEHLLKSYGTVAKVGASLSECLPPERARLWPHLYERVVQEGSYQLEYPLNGDQILDFTFHPILQYDQVVGISIFGKDITERKKVEEALRASEENTRKILDRAPMGIYRRDLEGAFAYSSPGLWKQFGCASREQFEQDYPDFRQRWSHPEQHQAFTAKLLKDGKVEGFVNKARLKSGEPRWHLLFAYLDPADPRYFDGFSIDVTLLKLAEAERVKIKEQLHQSQKMEAIGQLAGGIAHDFNNMLMGIIGAAELLASEADPLAPALKNKYLNMILQAANRAGDLTRKLLASARKDEQPFSPVDLRQVVADALAILERTLDKRIALQLDDQATGTLVLGNASMLANVFLNMGINAGQAMPDGGTLTFILRTVHLDQAFCEGSAFALTPGQHVQVEVRDSGFGMSAAVRDRIFEPFFTTKLPGQGTGLGLAVVYGTIQDHAGAVHVYSEEGVGTAFHVYLPLAGALAEDQAPVSAPLKGTGTILVVDDEELLRATIQAMLTQLGYTVLTAADGLQAMAVFRQAHATLDLVILDMIMPVMAGRQAFEQMRALDPSVPVLLSSGFSKAEDLQEMTQAGLSGFIMKPYRILELSKAVALALGTARAAGK